jgi:hypothetical protein
MKGSYWYCAYRSFVLKTKEEHLFIFSQRRFWAFSMNAKLKLPEMFGLLRHGFLLLITPQKQARWKGNSILNLFFVVKIKFSI